MGIKTSSLTPFIIGVNRNGESIKINNDYYPLIEVIKVKNRLEYLFQPNIFLTLERTNKKLSHGYYKLFYKLIQDKRILMGDTMLQYKPINMNSPMLDLITEIQKK